MSLGDRCRQEVVDLHSFFERWFSGELVDAGAARARISNALDDDFHLVSPRGVVDQKQHLVAGIVAGGGHRRGMEIRVEGIEVVHESSDAAVVVYREWQEHDGRKTGRISTAVLRADDAGPNGVRWMHVHETWLPGHGDD